MARRDHRGTRSPWMMARTAERNYTSALLGIARQIDQMVRGMSGDAFNSNRLEQTLRSYADLINPWAENVARYVVTDVARRNMRGWLNHGQDISRAMRVELEQAPTGSIFAALQQEQVKLIRSIPLEAAQRVHILAERALTGGHRPEMITRMLLNQGEVSKAKARLIGRTEVSRAATNFTQARSIHVGSEGYIWRSSEDGDVRPTHRAQNGKFIRWDAPPKTDKGLAPYHAGCGPNCRCWPDPVLPD